MERKDKYTINHHSLTQAEHTFEWEYDDEMFADSGEDSGITGGEGTVHVTLKKGANLMEAQVEIEGVVKCECDRCMEEYEQEVDFQGEVVIKTAHEKGEYDGDIIWLDPSDDVLDMEQWIFESIVLSLPMQRMHSSTNECNPEAMKYLSGEAATDDSEENEEETE